MIEFKKGKVYKSTHTGSLILCIGVGNKYFEGLYLGVDEYYIYEYKMGSDYQEVKSPISISDIWNESVRRDDIYPYQLFKSMYGGIVLALSNESATTFEGVCLKGDSIIDVGEHNFEWGKKSFSRVMDTVDLSLIPIGDYQEVGVKRGDIDDTVSSTTNTLAVTMDRKKSIVDVLDELMNSDTVQRISWHLQYVDVFLKSNDLNTWNGSYIKEMVDLLEGWDWYLIADSSHPFIKIKR